MTSPVAAGADGLAVINKDAGWTSHDVVAKARGILGTRKIGHSGTLDPDVTGVLLLGVGRVTKLLRFLTMLGKDYEGTFALGTETTTLDASGEIAATHDMSSVTLEDVQKVAADRFVGEIQQVPPMVSAVKVGGKRLHELARQGVEVEREPRRVTVHSLTISAEPNTPGTFGISLRCSSGTYVRSLVADIGRALGGGGHLVSLRREAVGSFSLSEAVSLESLSPDKLLTPAEAVRGMASVAVNETAATAISHGQRLPIEGLALSHPSGPWAMLNTAGELLAVYQSHDDAVIKPAVVIRPAT